MHAWKNFINQPPDVFFERARLCVHNTLLYHRTVFGRTTRNCSELNRASISHTHIPFRSVPDLPGACSLCSDGYAEVYTNMPEVETQDDDASLRRKLIAIHTAARVCLICLCVYKVRESFPDLFECALGWDGKLFEIALYSQVGTGRRDAAVATKYPPTSLAPKIGQCYYWPGHELALV